MLKQVNVIEEEFALRAEYFYETGITTIGIVSHELDAEASNEDITYIKEKDTAEIYLNLTQLKEVISALTHITETIERMDEEV